VRRPPYQGRSALSVPQPPVVLRATVAGVYRGMTSVAESVVAEGDELLATWRRRYIGRPDLERHRLQLLALEREQLVSVAYREDALAERIGALPVDEDLRRLLRQCLVWIWKDEELHATYLRGSLLRTRRPLPMAVVFEHQLVGALSGWVTAARQQRRPAGIPLRGLAADAMVGVGRLTGRISGALANELHYRSFRRYCQLNVALERTAELAYGRLIELASDDDEQALFERVRGDERRHGRAFQALADALDDHDGLAPGKSVAGLVAELGEISTWLVPSSMRAGRGGWRSKFGTQAPVFVDDGDDERSLASCLERGLDRAGVGEMVLHGSGRVAVRASFMLGYDRRDRSNIVSPAAMEALAAYLWSHGALDVAVLEAPTVYGRYFRNRSVGAVAAYFGFCSPLYRIVDTGTDQQPFPYQRGLLQNTLSRTWWDADVRIVVAKLRTDPNEFGHLCLSSLEGMASQIDQTVYTSRQLDFRTATMMLIDAAPPDAGVIDAWGPIADGPVGMMGCRHPARSQRFYVGRDALSVDCAALSDMGLADPRRAPIVRRALHWFGVEAGTAQIRGRSGPFEGGFRDPWSRRRWRALAIASYPIYEYLSGEGKMFVPAMDEIAFPPFEDVGWAVSGCRRLSQIALGMRPATERARGEAMLADGKPAGLRYIRPFRSLANRIVSARC